MGEARRRKAEIGWLKEAEEAWLRSLKPAERTVADVARRTHKELVERRGLIGGCYLLAFFLNELLLSKYSIETDLIVGWVNDGTWPGAASHAWVEMGGRKIDISLTRTELPEIQPAGDLLILDRAVRPDGVKYTYYREPPREALEYVDQMVRDGHFPRDAVEAKNHEHNYVLGLSKTREGIRTYLGRSPPDRTFEALLKIVD